MGNSRTQEGTLNLRDFIDSQLATWPLAADNFRKLAQVVTRRIATSDGCISLQHNPARAVSTGAPPQPSLHGHVSSAAPTARGNSKP
jgi:ABC-type Fe2+-enterobactin transport system substrate-binding protein